MRLVGAPPAGLLVQRLGERRIYISGLLIVALSTGACAFAQTYWQLLLFRSLGGIGSTMFIVSVAGPDDPDLPARRPRPGRRACSPRAFLVGSVGGPVLGSLTAGLGLSRAVRHLRRRAAGRGGGGVRQPAAIPRWRRRTEPTSCAVTRAGGAAPPGLPGGAAVQLRDRLVGVRPAHRAGAAVRRRGAATAAPGVAGLALADVRRRQRRRW